MAVKRREKKENLERQAPKTDEEDSTTCSDAGASDAGESSEAQESSEKKQTGSPRESEGSKTVFVKGISFDLEEEGLKEMFSKYGEVTDVRIPRRRDGRKTKGFGYVEFASEESAQRSLEMDGQIVDERTLVVNMARSFEHDREDRKKQREEKRMTRDKNAECILFIKNLPYDFNNREFEEYLSSFANVQSIRIPQSKETGRKRGFCFVTVANEEEAEKILEQELHFCDRGLTARYYKEDDRGGDEGRGRDRRYSDRRYNDRRGDDRRYNDGRMGDEKGKGRSFRSKGKHVRFEENEE